MATKQQYKTTFEVDQVIQPIFTGGSVSLENGARILASTLGEDAALTDLTTGKLFAKIEGVRHLSEPQVLCKKGLYANTMLPVHRMANRFHP